MNLAQIEAMAAGKTQNVERSPQPDVAAVRKMAAEFESLLLNQLTASLNPKEGDDEETLFSNNGGLGLSRQMFGEQLAKTMSESGGVGLADMIVRQITHQDAVKSQHAGRGLAAAREIRAEAATPPNAVRISKESALVGNAQNLDPIIISEAPVASSAPPALNASSASEVSGRTANLPTRPRRVHPIGPRATIGNSQAAHPRNHVSAAAGSPNAFRPIGSVSLNLPIRGAIRSVFGPRRDPINGRHRFHQGVDIAATRGTPIAAAAAGTVVFSGRNKGYGNMVMIEHADGRRTLYAHAESLFVRAGDQVRAGQQIAAVGSTGHSTGPHLHFEVREGNQAVNPLSVLANDFTLARR